ncbi:hypothetical protein [Xanthomonas sp. NCPPB 2632]|uniref:hypothetical protein n=1 Tax=Xanthomonas sp. NCPPB 2632 TaxID=3240912 RepID=UPI003515977D
MLLELRSGGTNPAEVRRLIDLPHVEVKQFTRLHAKAYIAKEGVVIGSTNASANGLGSEGSQSTSWHELAVRTTDASVVQDTKRWFKNKWSAGQPIKSRDLTQAELKWKERQKIRPKGVNKAKDILAAALDDPNNYRNRDLFVVVTTIPWDSEGDADAKDYKEKTGHQALGWQEWPAIPKNAKLICFTDYNGEDFQWDKPKVCYSPGKLFRHRSLVLVSADTLDDSLKPGDIRQWTKALTAVKATIPKKRWSADSGMCMDLGDFADRVLGNPRRERGS